MLSALQMAEELLNGKKLPSKFILGKLKEAYVAYLEREFFDQIHGHLFSQMTEEDRFELVAFRDEQLKLTAEKLYDWKDQVGYPKSEVESAIFEWVDLLGFPYGVMMHERSEHPAN